VAKHYVYVLRSVADLQFYVPIARVDTSRDDPFVSTGQTVNVYIRSGYRNSGAQVYPRLTLAVAGVGTILSLFAKRRADQPKPEI
jgi:hypothetical protein